MTSRELGVVLLLVGALSACDLERAEDTTTSEFPVASGSRASISIRLQRGSVEIEGSDTDRVELVVRKRSRSVDAEAARALLERIQIGAEQEGNRIRIVDRTRFPDNGSFGVDLRSDLVLRVPRSSDVEVRTGDGRIRVEDVRGTIVAETDDGSIRLERTGGNATLRSGDGSLGGLDMEGEVDAQTEDGSIELSGSLARVRAVTGDGRIRVDSGDATSPSGEWLLHTADGSIGLTLASSLSAEIDATTSSGSIDNRLSSFHGSEGKRRLRGSVGNGGALIVLSTMDGRIELKNSR